MKMFKWLGIIVLCLVLLGTFAFFAVKTQSNSRIDKIWEVDVTMIDINGDSAALINGKHQAAIRGCTECHGQNLGGKVFLEDEDLGTIYASNITSGKGGLSNYTDEDYLRAIRHGIDQEGKSLFIMPAEEYYFIDNNDMGDLIGYLKSVPPVDNELPEHDLYFLAHALNTAGELRLLVAEMVDHEAPLIESAPEKLPTAEYGEYLAITCVACHQKSFIGGKIAGMPPDWPEASNLTKTGVLPNYDAIKFAQALRTGIKPDGNKIDPMFMPWPAFGQMDDVEMEALFNYLQTL